jgi:hypothetical protein
MINPKLPRDVRQVRLQCRVDPRDLPQGVTKIDEVYITDLSVTHHYCSPAKLAYCVFVRTEFTLADGLSEEEQERLSDLESETCAENDYFDYTTIKALPFVKWDDDPEDTDEETMEAAREYFQGNHQ